MTRGKELGMPENLWVSEVKEAGRLGEHKELCLAAERSAWCALVPREMGLGQDA